MAGLSGVVDAIVVAPGKGILLIEAKTAEHVEYRDGQSYLAKNSYKTELIRQRGPWRTVEQVELATLEYVWWWNNQRLHGDLDMRTPLEVE